MSVNLPLGAILLPGLVNQCSQSQDVLKDFTDKLYVTETTQKFMDLCKPVEDPVSDHRFTIIISYYMQYFMCDAIIMQYRNAFLLNSIP